MTLEDHGQNNYSSESDLKAMRTVGNDHHPHIVLFYGALIDYQENQLIICMEALQTSLDKFYPILHSRFHPTPILLDFIIRRIAKHVKKRFFILNLKNEINLDGFSFGLFKI
jgi:hypothetical protein